MKNRNKGVNRNLLSILREWIFPLNCAKKIGQRKSFLVCIRTVQILLLILFTAFNSIESIEVYNGVLDLRTYTSEKEISTSGDWEYLDGIRDASEFEFAPFFRLPNSGYKSDFFRGVSGQGASTFRLRIFFPESAQGSIWAIRTAGIRGAYQISINEKLILAKGKLSASPDENEINASPAMGFFQVPSNFEPAELILQLSNNSYHFGGILESPRIGASEIVRKQFDFQRLFDVGSIAICFILVFLHAGLFLSDKRDISNLKLTIVFLFLSLLLMVSHLRMHSLMEILAFIPYEVNRILDQILVSLIPVVMVLLAEAIFPRLELKGYRKIALGVALSTILLSLPVFAKISVFSISFGTLSILVFTFLLINKILFSKKKKNMQSLFLSLVYLCVLFLGFADMMYLTGVIFFTEVNILVFSILLFALVAGVIFRIGNSFKKVVKLGAQLKEVNEQLEMKVQKRTEELNRSLWELHRDLGLARKIQGTILPTEKKFEQFEVKSLYIPVGEVSGDLYDFYEVEPGRVRFFLADATGHGLQAALMTVAIKSELESLKSSPQTSVDNFLIELNKNICQKFKDMFFSCVVCDLYALSGKIEFSMAGHPPQILLKNNGEIIQLSTKGLLAGIQEEFVFYMNSVQLQKGDRVVLFSDGMYEQVNEEKVPYGQERFFNSIKINSGMILDQFMEKITLEMHEFMGKMNAQDDSTMLVIEHL